MRPSDIHRRREEERFRLYGNDDQPDFVSQPQEEQYTPQHTSQSPTVYIQRVSTPAPDTSQQVSMTHRHSNLLYLGLIQDVEPNTPPDPFTPSSFQEEELADPRLSLNPHEYRRDRYLETHINAGLEVPIPCTSPVSPGTSNTGSPMPWAYDEAFSHLASSSSQEDMGRSNSQAPVGYGGTSLQPIQYAEYSPRSAIGSIPSPISDISNSYVLATSSMFGSRPVSTRSKHNKPTVRPERSRVSICKICGVSVIALSRHIHDKHPDTLSIPLVLFDCHYDGCGRKGDDGFKRNDNLTQHLRNVHGQIIAKRSRRKTSKRGSGGRSE